MAHYHQRDYLGALEAFRLAIPGFGDDNNLDMLARTNAQVGFILEKLGQKESAHLYYAKARQLFESINSTDKLHGIVMGLLGMHQESNRILLKFPQSPTALNWIGLNLRSMGFLDSAIYYHRQVLIDDSLKVWPHVLIGNTLTEKGEYHQAIQCYETALRLAPENREVLRYNIKTEMGNVNLLMGDYQAAIDHLLATGLSPGASNLEIAQRNHDLLAKAYQGLRLSKMEQNLEYLKMAGLLLIFTVAWFLVRQQRINSKISLRLNKMYTQYLDAVLRRAIQDIDTKRPGDAKKDIELARNLTKKIKSY
jgi:tetratricopeptide (TPR) repeat protein